MAFIDCALFAILKKDSKNILIQRISADWETQLALNNLFSSMSENYLTGLSPIEFDGKYVPQEDDKEYLTIKDFSLPEEIKEAIRNPLGIELYKEDSGNFPKIKALFLGNRSVNNGIEAFEVVFQKFRNDQYITRRRLNLFLSDETFIREKRNGISIGETIEALYLNNNLAFRSYYYARQIFDLSDYYRIASNIDVEAFISSKLISCNDTDEYINRADIWERKKIASILDSNMLGKFTAEQIHEKAMSIGVNIDFVNNKIVFPVDKRKRKVLLGFLAEEVYKGVFTNNVYQTNSKKRTSQELP